MATISIFATVGTTQFDKFIQHLTSSEVLKVLREKGYSKFTLQIGRGEFVPEDGIREGIQINHYRFKDSLADDMMNADLIISHAGAGSCLEALEAGKPLLVVVNEDLMDNHQTELAHEFSKLGFLYYCTCQTLAQTLRSSDFSSLTPYVKGDASKFAAYLDEHTWKNSN